MCKERTINAEKEKENLLKLIKEEDPKNFIDQGILKNNFFESKFFNEEECMKLNNVSEEIFTLSDFHKSIAKLLTCDNGHNVLRKMNLTYIYLRKKIMSSMSNYANLPIFLEKSEALNSILLNFFAYNIKVLLGATIAFSGFILCKNFMNPEVTISLLLQLKSSFPILFFNIISNYSVYELPKEIYEISEMNYLPIKYQNFNPGDIPLKLAFIAFVHAVSSNMWTFVFIMLKIIEKFKNNYFFSTALAVPSTELAVIGLPGWTIFTFFHFFFFFYSIHLSAVALKYFYKLFIVSSSHDIMEQSDLLKKVKTLPLSACSSFQVIADLFCESKAKFLNQLSNVHCKAINEISSDEKLDLKKEYTKEVDAMIEDGILRFYQDNKNNKDNDNDNEDVKSSSKAENSSHSVNTESSEQKEELSQDETPAYSSHYVLNPFYS